jgi:uncharacterized DUF497 family protein
VSFEDAQYVFGDPLKREVYDEEHSVDEDRWIVFGDIGFVVMVVITYPAEGVVRIISAREANAHERRKFYG